MDSTGPEIQPPPQAAPPAEPAPDAVLTTVTAAPLPEPWETRAARWVFLGNQGLRSGWSVLLFALLFGVLAAAVGLLLVRLHLIDPKMKMDVLSFSTAFWGELVNLVPLVGAAAVMALIERRRNLLAYNLVGPRRTLNFFSGVAAGFVALSLLVGALDWGGWLHFGAVALSGAQIYKFAGLWAVVFLMVGCVEEGIFRCYILFTLTRGINFWWALGTAGVFSLLAFVIPKSNGPAGVCVAALLGLLPCLWLHLKKAEGAGFWQATWVTSTIFGFIHTGNSGESWLGIFSAAFVGFVFCVSVRLTGSAWWAIGCHGAWDWAQSYFYGTPDSGMIATGHYLTTSPAGNPLWSGGADGPEGSVLVLGAVLFLLLLLLVLYGRRKPAMTVLERAIG
ncbi:MAG: CPBP family intramembrane glutamic endopeptidase [Terracidiphilus sp.]|jgi:membrane protease YdiL (CAAX protease family)